MKATLTLQVFKFAPTLPLSKTDILLPLANRKILFMHKILFTRTDRDLQEQTNLARIIDNQIKFGICINSPEALPVQILPISQFSAQSF
jgi:hypothetical protein